MLFLEEQAIRDRLALFCPFHVFDHIIAPADIII